METVQKKLIVKFKRADLHGEVTFLDDNRIIVHRDLLGKITAMRNSCMHQGGTFMKGDSSVLTCCRHGWKLDAATCMYVNPIGSRMRQEALLLEEDDDGQVSVCEHINPNPWQRDQKDVEVLTPGEFTIRFYAHACVEIQCDTKRLFTDPWLIGPAFTRGWWLTHNPPADWLEKLAQADAIFISHSHSDHLNNHTLKQLALRNPEIPIYVPQFDRPVCEELIHRCGLTNVISVPFGSWISFGKKGRFMMLRDGTARDDSGLLVEYKGHLLLNTVDCSNLNNGVFPAPVDVLLTNFAGGATGYPVCWPELYSEDYMSAIIARNINLTKTRIGETVKKTQARAYIPFAGFFTEAHPSDAEIKRLNVKNTPAQVCDLIHNQGLDTVTWIPRVGGTFDIASSSSHSADSSSSEKLPMHDFKHYTEVIANDAKHSSFANIEAVKKYFRTAGFRGNIVLHVIEMDEDFASVIREFFVDFYDMSFPEKRPEQLHRYLRMRVRSDVFRYALQHRLSWEEMSIGFQARFYREPDAYNFDFWDHFQNKLLAQEQG